MRLLKEYMIKNIEMSKEHFIEAFTHVYGEEYHDFIKERINNTKILICHDTVDRVLLHQIRYKIEKFVVHGKQEALDAVDKAIKIRKLYDNYEKHILSELKKMFPELKDTMFPRAFISSVESFDLKLGKDRWRNKSIMMDRVRYFKLLGLDLGDDYSEYENNQIAKKMIPSKEKRKQFKELCEVLYAREKQLISMFSSNYLEIQEELSANNYDRKEVVQKDMDGKNISYCMPNSKSGTITPLCMFNIQTILEDSEMVFAHEFAHSIGLIDLTKSNLCCGKKYIWLNEAVEDYSVMEVYKYMLEKNYTIFRENPSLENNSIYKYIIPIGKAFVEKFKDNMLTIRFGTEDELYKIVDEELLDKVDTICYSILDEVKKAPLLGHVYTEYIKMLETIAINKIKEYKPNNKR